MPKRVKRIVLQFMVVAFTTAVAYGLNVVGILPIWDDLSFRGGTQNVARSVVLHRNLAIVGEVLGRPVGDQTDVVIRGYNATTGNLVWTDEFEGMDVRVAAFADEAIAVGARPMPAPMEGFQNIEMRGYDLKQGTLRWTRQTRMTGPQAVLVRNGKLILVGYDEVFAPNGVLGRIRVFDASVGIPLWDAVIEDANPIAPDTAFWDVDDSGRFIIAVGSVQHGLDRDLVLRSYRLRDGHLRWEHTESHVAPFGVRVVNDTAYVAGSENQPGNLNEPVVTYLAAFDIGDGTREWKANPSPNESAFTAIAATASTVVVAGLLGHIEAHDALTGNLLWSAKGTTEEGALESIRELLAVGASTIAVGNIDFNIRDHQAFIRVYDESGRIVAEDKRSTGQSSSYVDAATDRDFHRLVAVGSIGGITGGALVQAYDLITKHRNSDQKTEVEP